MEEIKNINLEITKLEKEAFKWGKAKKSSDLEKMYMNR